MHLTAPIHLAAGKNGSPLVHVLARGTVAATNGTIVAAYDCGEPTGESDHAYSPRPFKSAWADTDDGCVSVELHKQGGIVRVTTEGNETVATDYSRERVVDVGPIIDTLSAPVTNSTEVWIDAAQLAKLAKALGCSKGEPVKLTIQTQRGRGVGLVHVSRESAPDVRGGIMANEEIVDAGTGASAVKAVPIALQAVGEEAAQA